MSDSYAASLLADLRRSYDALAGLQRDVERECVKSRPSKQRLREALNRSDRVAAPPSPEQERNSE